MHTPPVLELHEKWACFFSCFFFVRFTSFTSFTSAPKKKPLPDEETSQGATSAAINKCGACIVQHW